MVYLGSKARYARFIVPIIQEQIAQTKAQLYVEPFVGGANIITKVQCPLRIGYDCNKYLIALLANSHKVESLPDFISKEHYDKVRLDYVRKESVSKRLYKPVFDDWYTGAIGFFAGYSGKFFAGYSVVYESYGRNAFRERKRNFLKDAKEMERVAFITSDYTGIEDFEDAVIYCDPPYEDTTEYVHKNFDSIAFWAWAKRVAEKNVVLVSERSCPMADAQLLWEKNVKVNFDSNRENAKVTREKLFLIKG